MTAGPEKQLAATFENLCIADTWKLAVIFAELLSHLVLGSNSVQRFHDFITTEVGVLDSNELSNSLYNNSVKVKDEVIVWLQKLAGQDTQTLLLLLEVSPSNLIRANVVGPLI